MLLPAAEQKFTTSTVKVSLRYTPSRDGGLRQSVLFFVWVKIHHGGSGQSTS